MPQLVAVSSWSSATSTRKARLSIGVTSLYRPRCRATMSGSVRRGLLSLDCFTALRLNPPNEFIRKLCKSPRGWRVGWTARQLAPERKERLAELLSSERPLVDAIVGHSHFQQIMELCLQGLALVAHARLSWVLREELACTGV